MIVACSHFGVHIKVSHASLCTMLHSPTRCHHPCGVRDTLRLHTLLPTALAATRPRLLSDRGSTLRRAFTLSLQVMQCITPKLQAVPDSGLQQGCRGGQECHGRAPEPLPRKCDQTQTHRSPRGYEELFEESGGRYLLYNMSTHTAEPRAHKYGAAHP